MVQLSTQDLWMGRLRLGFKFPIHFHSPKVIPIRLYLDGKVVSEVAPHSPVSDPLRPPATFQRTKHSVGKEWECEWGRVTFGQGRQDRASVKP